MSKKNVKAKVQPLSFVEKELTHSERVKYALKVNGWEHPLQREALSRYGADGDRETYFGLWLATEMQEILDSNPRITTLRYAQVASGDEMAELNKDFDKLGKVAYDMYHRFQGTSEMVRFTAWRA